MFDRAAVRLLLIRYGARHTDACLSQVAELSCLCGFEDWMTDPTVPRRSRCHVQVDPTLVSGFGEG